MISNLFTTNAISFKQLGKSLFVLMILLLFQTTISEAQTFWDRTFFENTSIDLGLDIYQDSEGNLISINRTRIGGERNTLFIKSTDQGTLINRTTLAINNPIASVQINDNQYIIATNDFPNSNLVTIDGDGNILSDIDISEEFSSFFDMIYTDDGHIVIAHLLLSGELELPDYAISKIDLQGNLIWQNQYGALSDDISIDLISQVIQTNDGGFLMTGQYEEVFINEYKTYVVKTDANGNEEWDFEIDKGGYEGATSALSASDGGYVIQGYVADGQRLREHIFKLGSDGDLLWSNIYGNGSNFQGRGNLIEADGNYVIAHIDAENAGDPYSIFLLGIETDGTELYSRFSRDGFGASNIIQAPDGHFILLGNTQSNNSGINENVSIFKFINPLIADENCIGDLEFNSQADLDAFMPCDTIFGSITINGDDITDLSPLYSIKHITSFIVFQDLPQLTTIEDAFPNLEFAGVVVFPTSSFESIDGFNALKEANNLFFFTNENLVSISGFNNLEKTSQISIEGHPLLESVTGFESLNNVGYLSFTSNAVLANLDFMSTVEGENSLLIAGNNGITNLDGLINITGTSNFGQLIIASNPLLTNLDGLSNITSADGQFVVSGNDILENLDGLSSLTSVGSSAFIDNNPLIENLDGLSNLALIEGSFNLSNNENLTECCAIAPLLSEGGVNGEITIENNVNGCNSLDDLLTSCGFYNCTENIEFTTQAQVEDFALNGCDSIFGSLIIIMDDISDLTPLSNILYIEEDLTFVNITETPQLETIEGFDNLTYIGGTFFCPTQNEILQSINGFNSLEVIGNGFELINQSSLNSISGFSNLTSLKELFIQQSQVSDLSVFSNVLDLVDLILIDTDITNLNDLSIQSNNFTGDIIINANEFLMDISAFSTINTIDGLLGFAGNPILTNLNGLENLTSIGGDLLIRSNDLLTDVNALNNLTSIGENLTVTLNPVLNECCVFDEIINNTLGSIDFSGNATSCNNYFAFEQLCAEDDCEADVYLSSQEEVDNWLGCTEVVGTLTISGNDITDLSPLATLTKVGNLQISNNPLLANLNGLENLETSEGGFVIIQNESLTDLTGLSGLKESTGFTYILNNSSLATLDGLENLETVETFYLDSNPILSDISAVSNLQELNNLQIIGNPLITNVDPFINITTIPSGIIIASSPGISNVDGFQNLVSTSNIVLAGTNLENIDGLSSLTTVENFFVLSADSTITNVDGLNNLSFVGNSFSISGNPLLTDCCGIYPILQTGGVQGDIFIEDNPNGCSSQSDIFTTCDDGTGTIGVDLEMTMSSNFAEYERFKDITFTIELKNDGTERTDNIKVAIPEASSLFGSGNFAYTGHTFGGATADRNFFSPTFTEWSIAYLEPGETAVLNLILYTLGEDEDLTVFAQVTSSFPVDVDATPGNDTNNFPNEDDEASATISPADFNTNFADIEVYASANKSQVMAGEELTYFITVNNKGRADATDIQVSMLDFLNNITPNGIIASQGTYDENTMIWNVGNIDNGSSAILSLTIIVNEISGEFTAGWQLTNVGQNDKDSAPNNGFQYNFNHEDDEASVTIIEGTSTSGSDPNLPDLELSLEVDNTDYQLNDFVTFTLTVTNTGNSEANLVKIDWPVPEGLAHSEATVSSGDYFSWSGEWFIYEPIAPGASESIEFVLWTNVGGVPITSYAQVVEQEEDDMDSTPSNGICCVANEDDEVALTIGTSFQNQNPIFRSEATTLPTTNRIQVFNVFPNPAVDRIKLTLNSPQENLELFIYDIKGRMVSHRKYEEVLGPNEINIDIKNLPSGVYYIRFNSRFDHAPVKFIKQDY